MLWSCYTLQMLLGTTSLKENFRVLLFPLQQNVYSVKKCRAVTKRTEAKAYSYLANTIGSIDYNPPLPAPGQKSVITIFEGCSKYCRSYRLEACPLPEAVFSKKLFWRNGQEPNPCCYWLVNHMVKVFPTSPPRYKVSSAEIHLPSAKPRAKSCSLVI